MSIKHLANWTRITSSVRLYRSSHAVSVVGQKAFIFGGELVPRQPVDNRLDVVQLGSERGMDQASLVGLSDEYL